MNSTEINQDRSLLFLFINNINKRSQAEHLRDLRKIGNMELQSSLTNTGQRISSIYGRYGTGLNIIEKDGVPSMSIETKLDISFVLDVTDS